MRMIDGVDLRILNVLQKDARATNADMARRLAMAPSAIHQRVRKLEERGVIAGYAARVEPRAVGRGLLAFVHLATEDDLGETRIPYDVAALPGVLEVHDVAGDDGYLVKVRVADTDALHRLLHEGIGSVRGVRSTRTTIVLHTFAEEVALPLPDAGELR